MAGGKSYITEVGPAKPAANGKPATGPEYRAVIAKDGPPTLPGVSTLYEMFARSVEKFPNNPCLGKRTTGDFEWLTYAQVSELAGAIGSAMAAVGVSAHGRAGVYGANCPEWMTAMQACNRMTVYCIPLYDSLGENAIEYIVDHSEASIVFVQSEKFAMLAKALPKLTHHVKNVVYWGAGDVTATEVAKKLGMGVYSWDEFIALGRSNPSEPCPPKAEDLCTIMYTSGTTGDPKGALINHEAVLSVLASQLVYQSSVIEGEGEGELTEDDCYLSYLPLAHIFDRSVGF